MRFENIGAWIMKRVIFISGICVFTFCASSPVSAATQWDVGISGGRGGIEGFHISIGEYYRVPEREVVVIHDRGIDDEELPVVFFIAERAHVRPEIVVDLRHRGMSWMDITLHFGLSPEIYYVPVRDYRPYGHAYGYYENHPRRDWGRMHFRDRDIVDQVNLRFISEHQRYNPDRIMKYRSEGRRFSDIDRQIGHERQGKVTYNDHRTDKSQKQGRASDRSRNDNWQQNPNQGKGHPNQGQAHGNYGGHNR